MRYGLLYAVMAALALVLWSGHAQAQGQQATTELKNASGQVVGSATLTQQASGVQVRVQVSGLDAGQHGIHLHTVGKCEGPDFASAGGHFNPLAKKHGHDNPEGPHAGDLGNPPNITISADRTGALTATSSLVTLAEGVNSLLDADGSALVIHAGLDDNKTDPAGNSGARVACGVIVAMAAALPRTGGTLVAWWVIGLLGGAVTLAGVALRRPAA
ncbi:MAG: superoxide dismutase family protein [Anaerolineae bacterium]|nr:superoxide dismutase family protein [Anaerolineae bacterium]